MTAPAALAGPTVRRYHFLSVLRPAQSASKGSRRNPSLRFGLVDESLPAPTVLRMTDNQALPEAVRAIDRPLRLDNPTAFVPACRLEDLGDPSFRADHRLRYAYVAGAMANGIGSVEIVEAMSRAGMLGFFGAAGLSPARVETAIDRLRAASATPRTASTSFTAPTSRTSKTPSSISTCAAASAWSRRRRIST